MFHKIKNVVPLKNYIINVRFTEGVTKQYDLKPLFDKYEFFRKLKDKTLFEKVTVGPGGYGIVWDDELDLACDELFNNGTIIKTPFDNLIAFSEATELWGLNESTLRKAISYNKLIEGVDACKYGKQWVVSVEAMIREYGTPQTK